MNAKRLLAFYDRVADAPDAIARLRRFVLDLAVRGKLVEQNPTYEPASDLSMGIAQQGIGDYYPLRNWSHATVGDVFDFKYGKGLKASERTEDGPVPVYGSNGVVGYTTEPLTVRPSVIVGRKGSAGALNKCNGPSWTTDVAYFVEVPDFFDLVYLFLLLQTLDLNTLGKGVKPGLSRADAYRKFICIPPLAEQRRIVAKVDELMALCEQLEEARIAREDTRDRLTKASLARLIAPDTDDVTFRSHARFAVDALPALTARADQVTHFRQTILNLAVQGRLVDQYPNDKPASALLTRIATEKARGGSKKGKASAWVNEPGSDDQIPFHLPTGWAQSTIGKICSKTGSGSTPRGGKNAYKPHGVIFLRSQNVHNNGLRLTDVAYIDERTHERMSGTSVRAADLLLNITGGSIGRCCLVPDDLGQANVSQHVSIIRPAIDGLNHFLHCVILAPYFQAFIFDEQTGAGRGGLPKRKMDQIPIALPPIAEQKRIVTRVNELMVLCDRLESGLAVARTARSHLLESLLHEALGLTESGVKGAAASPQ